MNRTANTGGVSFVLDDSGGSGGGARWEFISGDSSNAGKGFILSNTTASTNNMFLANTGQVGIDTASPDAALEVLATSTSANSLDVVSTGSTTQLLVARASGNVGIATSSPSYLLSVGSTTLTAAGAFAVDANGNQYGEGQPPTVSCASTCSLDQHAHDSSGTIFISGVQTAVTLTFGAPKPWAPHCVASDSVTTGNYDASTTPTQIVFSTAASLGTASIMYVCQQ